VVGAALVVALVLDWSSSLNGYPAAAAYSIALLLASQSLAPQGVAVLVSHDLRSPLSTIRGYAQLARRRTPDVVHELATIETVADRMRRTLDDLLDTAHLQAGQQLALQCAATDLVALVQRAVADRRITAPDCSFSLSAAAAPLIGYWDAIRVERVVSNLLDDAVKYSSANAAIEVVFEQRAGHAVLHVRDHGIGIPADQLSAVFQPFQRASNTGAIGGSGLGLASASAVIAQHGGSIEVASREGEGSTFIVRLPFAIA